MPSLDCVVTRLLEQAAACRQRRALVLAGESGWCRQTAQSVIGIAAADRVLWVTRQPPEAAWSCTGDSVHSVLGRETGILVFDAWSGFDPDAFGASTGTLRGGGLLIVLTPPLDAWPDFDAPGRARLAMPPGATSQVSGRLLQHVARVMRRADGVTVVEQGQPVPAIVQDRAMTAAQHPPGAALSPGVCTDDQQLAVDAVLRSASGHSRRPVVLTADRGRGKSAALGIAAARLLADGARRIVVTAPRLAAVDAVFEHAHRMLPAAKRSRTALHYGAAQLEFIAPDVLRRAAVSVDLLLVDEAAAIPAPLLQDLLRHYSRIAFATTVHGYEGTGQGFALRFSQALDEYTNSWRTVRLETPIRWAAGDPVEAFVFRALLMNAAPAADRDVQGARASECHIECLDRDALVHDEALLTQLFGLLVTAHYRTRPYDLSCLLDGPNMRVFVMRYEQHVVATVLVVREGGFDAGMAQRVAAGERRPQGHLLPATLAVHVGLAEAPLQQCDRIIRIAVHPAVQQRGLGTRLLAAVVAAARNDQCDYIGSSFGATVPLLRFWARSALLPVWVGTKRGAASGEHAVAVLSPLSVRGELLAARAHAHFHDSFPHQLADPLRDLAPDLVHCLLQHSDGDSPGVAQLTAADVRELHAFVDGRSYEACMAPVWRLTHAVLSQPYAPPGLDGCAVGLLVTKVLQRHDWATVARANGLPGRVAVVAALRSTVHTLMSQPVAGSPEINDGQ